MLKEYLYLTIIIIINTLSKLVFIIIDREKIKNQRCEFSRKRTYAKNNEFLYLNIIYNLIIKCDEGLTFFFIRRSIFFTFYNKHL